MALVIFIGLQFTIQDYIIQESCMEPSFQEEQRVLVNKVIYKFYEPKKGDSFIDNNNNALYLIINLNKL